MGKATRMRGTLTPKPGEVIATRIERRKRCAIYSAIMVVTEQTGQERKKAGKEAAQEKRKTELHKAEKKRRRSRHHGEVNSNGRIR